MMSSLRARLFLLVLLAVAPAFGLAVHVHLRARRAATLAVQQHAQHLASLAAANHAALVEGARQLLVSLARLPALRGDDRAACDAALAEISRSLSHYLNLGVIEPDGRLRCSALAVTEPMSLGDRPYFRDAVATREFAIGEYQIGRITGRPTVNFAYPLLDESGELDAVVFAALALRAFDAVAGPLDVPPGGAVVLLDRRGAVLARVPTLDADLGQQLVDGDRLSSLLGPDGEGQGELRGGDGVPRFYAFAALEHSGPQSLVVGLGLPAAAL
jgi:C4-dicarboxylate-specific signal transduction histidine kinase